MDKESILKKSREENRSGDEFVKMQQKNAVYNGYCVANACLIVLACSCYLGIMSGNVMINDHTFPLDGILFSIVSATNLIVYVSKYAYLKKKRQLIYAAFWLCILLACIKVILKL